MTAISHRYDFVYLFDVANGNPNGDPDAGNLPRLDPETGLGLVTDVCLKRKVRDFVDMLELPNHEIIIRTREPLNPKFAAAAEALGVKTHNKSDGKWDKDAAKNRPKSEVRELQNWLCSKYFDVRTFGAVMATGPNAGVLRGPVQLTFATSIDRIVPASVSITRVADVDKEEGEMGRKHIVPYGLYRAHGFISARLANDARKGTGFSENDLALLWRALSEMFDHDRSAARGEMTARGLIVFEHESDLGNASASKLFERVTIARAPGSSGPPRAFADYKVTVNAADMPKGVTLHNMI
ncbi:MAG: type I-C CRISPR-associated protein Cas7/Csd2 [Beijerinckiaceae bacterium]